MFTAHSLRYLMFLRKASANIASRFYALLEHQRL